MKIRTIGAGLAGVLLIVAVVGAAHRLGVESAEKMRHASPTIATNNAALQAQIATLQKQLCTANNGIAELHKQLSAMQKPVVVAKTNTVVAVAPAPENPEVAETSRILSRFNGRDLVLLSGVPAVNYAFNGTPQEAGSRCTKSVNVICGSGSGTNGGTTQRTLSKAEREALLDRIDRLDNLIGETQTSLEIAQANVDQSPDLKITRRNDVRRLEKGLAGLQEQMAQLQAQLQGQ